LVIDARTKPHHAPPLEQDPHAEKGSTGYSQKVEAWRNLVNTNEEYFDYINKNAG
jgi:hypothetical protein